MGAIDYKICIPSFAPLRKISNTGTLLISPKTTITQAKAGITNSIAYLSFLFTELSVQAQISAVASAQAEEIHTGTIISNGALLP